jgi:uncharacterized membrane protein YedE/YeeE
MTSERKMESFLPWHGLAGGVLIGLSVGFYLIVGGRVSGISGIIEGLLVSQPPWLARNLAYVVGLPLGALAVAVLAPSLLPDVKLSPSLLLLAVAGVLVGLGARVAGGCTSGHGVCGLPRFSSRSIVATLTFMATAAATVFVARHVI